MKTPEEEQSLEINAEEIATAIAKVSRAMAVLDKSRLKRDTIVILLHHRTKICQRDINLILDNLIRLEHIFLKK